MTNIVIQQYSKNSKSSYKLMSMVIMLIMNSFCEMVDRRRYSPVDFKTFFSKSFEGHIFPQNVCNQPLLYFHDMFCTIYSFPVNKT